MKSHRDDWRRTRIAAAIAGMLAMAQGTYAVAQVEPASSPSQVMPVVTVVGTAPLTGLGMPLTEVPAAVQVVSAKDIEAQHPNNITAYLEQNVTSVTLNSSQGNPYQPDVNYRGFTASPLLGTPQGLSVFQDGVRVNEPFGDVVNWDLLAQSAIERIEVMPGSNPLFGLNTLGGAIAITTKNGRDNPGGSVEVEGGSFARRSVVFTQGGQLGHFDYFVTANDEADQGWADHNPSRVKQLFGKVGYTDPRTTVELSLTAADNQLQGTQTIPRSFLDNPRQAYTYPDENQNRAIMLNLSGKHDFSDALQLSGDAYYRHYDNDNLSSNVNGDYGSIDPATGAIDTVPAQNAHSVISQDSYGFALQLSVTGKVAGMDNQLMAGVSGDFANTGFTQYTQDAHFTQDRQTVGTGGFTLQTDASTRNSNLGVFVTDTLSLTRTITLTASARYNHASVDIEDLSGMQPLLNGSHSFSRINPALGLTYNPVPWLTAYANYSEGMRTPTAIELACADPAAPCSLPNDFIADPALKPVVSRTFEAGARGTLSSAIHWSAAVFRTDLQDDIQFVSSNGASTSTGYFQNVGTTRRQGFEINARAQTGPLTVNAGYTYLRATYQSSFVEQSASNSSADGQGNITMHPGDRIPGIPENTLKLRLDYAATAKWNVGANILYRSSIFARGDENNLDSNGRIAGYAIVDLDTTYQVTKQLQLFTHVNNLFDKRYADFGILGQNFFNGPGHSFSPDAVTNEQFLGMGAPRGVWVGLRYAWK
ncbi:Vitamin B12 transporter BtuB [Paraburkholderia domus]|uniref:TonB-dependent receptor n=1 Tax=Paraburkholderia domus TaxID=2793075 RepID=UPI001911EA7D|nr:TonB-dependent receptor [Burkholderia sp. R-70199]MBK5089230.1 TonB-dependent receptor [Burkholderia sp. R-69927]MBK5122703.1 TonB-dependent receptor [Burkholderia sp. R-69980]MBK5183550.1 TonB-dependent receptor [Burkholderia sp. R-69749]MCI0149638.1 TonB-dependent receptor [Paraburkholderia sediminicola]CAE6862077.1 Vitamin B12 transporter BtuB [Paraburkholderia domus]